jgi:hypothetical protein
VFERAYHTSRITAYVAYKSIRLLVEDNQPRKGKNLGNFTAKLFGKRFELIYAEQVFPFFLCYIAGPASFDKVSVHTISRTKMLLNMAEN